MLGYNATWWLHRRMLNNWLNSRAVTQFDDSQEDLARRLLPRLLDTANSSHPFENVKREIF